MNEINRRILELWEKESKSEKPNEYIARVPQFFTPALNSTYKESILYVGLNPSFSERNFSAMAKKIKDINKVLQSLLGKPKKVGDFYSWLKDKITDDYIKQLDKIDRLFIEHYPYFAKVKKIAEDRELNLLTTDLFCMRKTSQKDIRQTLFKDKKNLDLTDFAEQQVKIFLDIVKISRPRIILVGNALASNIILEYFKQNLEFDDGFGTYIWRVDGYKIPTFFSGMLSGQRALDNHSMKRLEWQIKRLLQP